MIEAWLVFEDAHAVVQQTRIKTPARVAYRRMIGTWTGQQQPHVHSARGGLAQCATKLDGRHKIGGGKPHPPLGRADAMNGTVRDLGMQNAACIADPAALRAGDHRGRLRYRGKSAARVSLPREHEQTLPVQHHRPQYKHQGLAPAAFGVTGRIELVGDAGTADEGLQTVDEQQLAVITQKIAAQTPMIEAIEKGERHTARPQPFAVFVMTAARTEIVELEVLRDAARHRSANGVDETIGYVAVLDEILHQQHVRAGAIDRREHHVIKFIAVDKQLETIAVPPRKISMLVDGGGGHAVSAAPAARERRSRRL